MFFQMIDGILDLPVIKQEMVRFECKKITTLQDHFVNLILNRGDLKVCIQLV